MEFFAEMGGFTLFLLVILLASLAQSWISRAYRMYSQIPLSRSTTGAQVAADILRSEGIYDISVELASTSGLSDHYDPSANIIGLLRDVYYGGSVASVAIAAHEASHAVQHAQRYPLFQLRSMLVPTTKFASSASWIMIILGLVLGSLGMVYVGIGLFALTTVFQLVTLPVELNASRRALAYLNHGVVDTEEAKGARKVLTAAAFTYLASLLISVMYLMRYMAIFGRRR